MFFHSDDLPAEEEAFSFGDLLLTLLHVTFHVVVFRKLVSLLQTHWPKFLALWLLLTLLCFILELLSVAPFDKTPLTPTQVLLLPPLFGFYAAFELSTFIATLALLYDLWMDPAEVLLDAFTTFQFVAVVFVILVVVFALSGSASRRNRRHKTKSYY